MASSSISPHFLFQLDKIRCKFHYLDMKSDAVFIRWRVVVVYILHVAPCLLFLFPRIQCRVSISTELLYVRSRGPNLHIRAGSTLICRIEPTNITDKSVMTPYRILFVLNALRTTCAREHWFLINIAFLCRIRSFQIWLAISRFLQNILYSSSYQNK